MRRRQVLRSGAMLGLMPSFVASDVASGADTWSGGRIEHLIPAANHERIQLKVIFGDPVEHPKLEIAGRLVEGTATDSSGLGYAFDAGGLSPGTRYELRLRSGEGALSEPWPLATFPAPDTEPEHVRLLLFTCAGGHPLQSTSASPGFLPMDTRRRLLARALSFGPHALLANGDHVYWDQRTAMESRDPNRAANANALYRAVGMLDRSVPVLGTSNESVLKVVAGQQITPLYGTTLRSTPSYFINDDHDHFENDEATERFVTLPPEHYQRRFLDFVRGHYLPDFLPDPERPLAISGTFGPGLNRNFGAFRWGRLCEMLMYDCAGYLTLKGAVAGLVPDEVEQWLLRRTADQRVHQLLHVPGHPMGWTAGKWREWYPDVADTGTTGPQTAQMGTAGRQFKLTTDKPKFMWQRGWWEQHQRLLQALAGQVSRPGIVLSGDLHATGHAQIVESGGLAFTGNPINTLITGTLGTAAGWPSAMRGSAPVVPSALRLESPAPITERNGFTIVDVTPDSVRVRLFAWRSELASVEAIDTLAPYHDVRIARGRVD